MQNALQPPLKKLRRVLRGNTQHSLQLRLRKLHLIYLTIFHWNSTTKIQEVLLGSILEG